MAVGVTSHVSVPWGLSLGHQLSFANPAKGRAATESFSLGLQSSGQEGPEVRLTEERTTLNGT